MSAADHTSTAADALDALLAEEAASTWLPAGAAANTATIELGDLADTADLPRESLRPSAAPRRRASRLRRAGAGRDQAVSTERANPPQALASVADTDVLDPAASTGAPHAEQHASPASPVGISDAAELLESEGVDDGRSEQLEAARRPRGSEEHFDLPRGPRPNAEDTSAPLVLERGPRPGAAAPSARSTSSAPAAAPASARNAPILRVVEAAPAAVDVDVDESTSATRLDQLLEELDAHEAVELAATRADDGAGVGERKQRVDAAEATPAARGCRRVLAPVAVATSLAAIAAVGALAWPAPEPTSRVLPATGEAITQALRSASSRSSALLEQLAREERQAERRRAAARAAKQRAEHARAAAKARRQRAAHAAAAQRHSAAPAPAHTTTSAPVVAAPAPRTSTSTTKHTAPAPVCHSDLGPC